MKLEDMVLDVEQHIEIKGSPEKVFAAVLHRFGKGNVGPDGQSLQLELEPKAGGRWYRDRGNGVGHLWGFVQAIKPPSLLEISGPLFMSYPANNHVEIKSGEGRRQQQGDLEASGGGNDRSQTPRERRQGLEADA
jgi:hypothetical protein